MRNSLYFLSCLLLALVFASSGDAQETYGKLAKPDGLREIEVGKALSQLPETGAKPEDFTPRHWDILQREEGDVNADGIKDFAFILVLDEKDTKYIESLKKIGWGPVVDRPGIHNCCC